MAEEFNEEDKAGLLERGFNNDQIEYLESLEMDKEQLYFDICKLMDDFDDTPEILIADYMREQNNPGEQNNNYDNNNNNNNDQQEGGRRRKGKTRKGRKTRKSRKTRKTRKTNKKRKHRRR